MHTLDVYDLPTAPSSPSPTLQEPSPSPSPRERLGVLISDGSARLRALPRLAPALDPARVVVFRTATQAIAALREREVSRVVLPWRSAMGGLVRESFSAIANAGAGTEIVDADVATTPWCIASPRPIPLAEVRVVLGAADVLGGLSALAPRLAGAQREPVSDVEAAAHRLAMAGRHGVGSHVREHEATTSSTALLCSTEVASRHGLAILATADAVLGEGQWVAVELRSSHGRGAPEGDGSPRTHTVLSLTTAHTRGALARCLAALSGAGIQLTALESLAIPGRTHDVTFALEAEGDAGTGALEVALHDLRPHARHVEVLGGWRAEGADVVASERATNGVPGADVDDVSQERVAIAVTEPRSLPKLLVEAAPSRERTVVHVGAAAIGGDAFVLIAGPCSVESREQVMTAAAAVKRAGGHVLRGGAYKPRTSPYAFQGLGEEGLALLAEAGRAHGLPTVTEVMRPEQVEVCTRYVDMLQVGARNMQNFSLLSELGATRLPILLKRGMSATIDDLLHAAEYILARGNTQVVLCERGIRTFETATRSTLDLSAIPVLRERTHLPVIVDPSHAAGVRRWVPALARGAKAVGADGAIIEIHPRPEEALSDGPQALTLPMWSQLADSLRGEVMR